jgi:hypothetical protein
MKGLRIFCLIDVNSVAFLVVFFKKQGKGLELAVRSLLSGGLWYVCMQGNCLDRSSLQV